MSDLRNIISIEWLKLRKSKVWVLSLFYVILPVTYGVIINTMIVMGKYNYDNSNVWLMLMMIVLMFYGTFFLPNIVSLIVGRLIGFEKRANNWNYLFLTPIKKFNFYMGKWICMCLFVVSVQVLMITLLILSGLSFNYTDELPLQNYIVSAFLGSLGAISLGNFLFFLFLRISSNQMVLILNFLFSLPVFFILSSSPNSWFPYLYPWALPFLGMTRASSSVLAMLVFLMVCMIIILLFSYLNIKKLYKI